MDISQPDIKKFLSLGEQGLVSPILWHGARPCSQCGGTMHSKWEPTASAWVCAGCYNEFAIDNGWETKPSVVVSTYTYTRIVRRVIK